MARRRRKQKIDRTPFQSQIQSLSHDGRGVAYDEQGNAIYIDYALPAETVNSVMDFKRKGEQFATATEVLHASTDRVEAKCEVFGQCGGCVLQHLDAEKQVEYKQAYLNQLLADNHVEAKKWLPAVSLSKWNYRRRARLGVKFVPKKGGVIIGFRERKSSFIQPTESCEVLLHCVSLLIPKLKEVISKLSCFDKIPQIEVSVAENAVALVLRHLQEFNNSDLEILTHFAKSEHIQLFLQPGNLKSVHPLYPESPEPLYYTLNPFDINIHFLPTDFIQVNEELNQVMVRQAIEMLELKDSDKVLDLFSGIGNFTLPIARSAKQVIGVEGDKALVHRADKNRELNQLVNAQFYFADLFDQEMCSDSHGKWLEQTFNKILIDPPRSGAEHIIRILPKFEAKRVVYISCGPESLARDANVMVNQHGYTLSYAGVMDMFPHTAHVESIAVFDKQ